MLNDTFRGRDSARRRRAVEKVCRTLAAAGAAPPAADGPESRNRYFVP